MTEENTKPVNGTAQPLPGKPPLPQIAVPPEVGLFLEEFAHSAQASIMDAISKMPAQLGHMPMFVAMKVIAELSYAYWPNVGPRMWDDMISEAVQRMAQFTILSDQAIAKWKRDAEQRLLEARANVIDKPLIILPGAGGLPN